MIFFSQIILSQLEFVLLILFSAIVIWRGLPEIALGMYLSTALWTRTVIILGVAQIWFLLAVIVLATLVYLHKQRHITLLPRNYRGIVVWMLLWVVWIAALLNFRDSEVQRSFYRGLILYDMLPLPLILLFVQDLQRLRRFAIAFMITCLIGGWKALQMIDIPLDYLLTDPTLAKTAVIRLGLQNYHWFAYMFDISLAFTLALFLQVRKNQLAMVLLLANAALCAYFLLLAGSRQAINGGIGILVLFVVWALSHQGMPRARTVSLAVFVLGIALWLYQTSPGLVLREGETGWFDTVNVVGSRENLWLVGWNNFESAPLTGGKFEFYIDSHNIWIGTLADQGIVGMFFFLGLIVFLLWQLKGIWRGDGSREVATWRLAFLAIVVFTLIHSLASGSVLSTWYLYVSIFALWWLRQMAEDTSVVAPAATETVIAQPVFQPVHSLNSMDNRL